MLKIETNSTLNRKCGGSDENFFRESADLLQLYQGDRTVWEAMAQVGYGMKSSDRANLKFWLSLYFVSDPKKEEVACLGDIRGVRPGFGVLEEYSGHVVGMRTSSDVTYGTHVPMEDVC